MRVLVTGGTGYIGSHTVVELQNAGHEAVIVDNYSNSKPAVLGRIKEITGIAPEFHEADVRDAEDVSNIIAGSGIDAVIHFAALKAVGESVAKPLEYYDNNMGSTISLLKAMERNGVRNFVFSSSATVYGDPESCPIREDARLSATNPYGRTKIMIEDILRDYSKANPNFNAALLRYFNPVGSHASGLIGEDPNGIPNNLVPYLAKVAIGELPELRVFGNDYPTPDGTGVRDYIHVVDLAQGHIAALDKLRENPGAVAYNLGTGVGYSVLDLVKAFGKACGREIPYKVIDRRPGDIAECFADSGKAEAELGWKAELGLDKMCEDTWRWQSMNPKGYQA